MTGVATFLQGKQEPLVVKDKVGWKTAGELGVSKFVDLLVFASVLRHCWLCVRKGVGPVKTAWFGGDDVTGALDV